MRNTIFRPLLKLSILSAVIFSIASTVNAVGVFDRNFGTNGRISTNVGNPAQANAVVIQPDGKILALGIVGNGGSQDTVLVRYNSNGSLDPSFGNGGIVVAALSPFSESANDLALQSDGKIIVVGNIYSPVAQSIDFSVARFNQNGTLDTSFGISGIATVNQGSNEVFNSVAVQSDGKIVAAGRTSDGDRTAVIRFNSNGSLDSGFGDSGLLFIEFSGFSQESFYTLDLLANGRILLGGQGSVTIPHSGTSNFLVALNSNGSFASDFGTNGTVIFWDGFISPGFDAAVLPDGRILVVSDKAYRFLSNGTRDTSFTGGNPGNELAVRSDGRFIIGGNFISNFASQIYAANGQFIGRARNLTANDIAVQSNDKFVFISSSGNNFIVTRLDAITSRGTRLADFEPDDKTDLIVRAFGAGSCSRVSGLAAFGAR